MSLVGLLLFLAFVFLLIKAILETLWGIWLLIKFALWSVLAILLDAAAALLRPFCKSSKPRKAATKKTQHEEAKQSQPRPIAQSQMMIGSICLR